ncbi:MAG: acyltransferase [Polaromonas sp.]|nr:acyltransferase [Polaromonas sp.]
MSSAIDGLRHLFCICIIMIHMTSASRYTPEINQQISNIGDYLAGSVCGFFMISGYLFKVENKAIEYAKKQCKRLLVPYIIFSLLYAMLLAIAGKINFTEGLKATILMKGAGMQLYFLPYLASITIGTNAILSIFHTESFRLLISRISLALLTIATIELPTTVATGSNTRLMTLYAVAFFTGLLVRDTLHKKSFRSANLILTTVIIGCAGVLDWRFRGLMIALILLLICIALKDHLPQRRIPGSGGVYLLHTPILNFTISLMLVNIGIEQEFNLIASVILTYAISLTATLIFISVYPRQKWLLLE